jgi:dienelactone hydrolase
MPMAGEGFKHRRVAAPITDVKVHFRRLGDIEAATARTFEAYCSSIIDLPRQYYKQIVDSPEDSIMLHPCWTYGGNMRLNDTNRRISSRCLSAYGRYVISAIAIFAGCTSESQGPQYEIFPPAGGKGAIVIVASGYSGPGYYRDFSTKLAELGYYTVLLDGKDLIDPGRMGLIVPGAENLQTIIADAMSSSQAIPGKVSLVGFSIGGAGVLRYGANLKDQAAAVVAYYPAITTTGWDMTTLAAGFQSPVLLLAGVQDHYENCCLIESMRELAEAPKAILFEYVEYPDAGHCFNLDVDVPLFTYRPKDAADAWARTVSFLDRLHPPGGK